MPTTRRRQTSSVQSPLETYLREINETALLSADDEYELAIAIGNGDMHLKNWSLLYPEEGGVRLAPVYDYLSTLTYVGQEDLGLNLAGTKQFAQVSYERFERLADRAHVSAAMVTLAAQRMVERIRDLWPSFRATVELPEELVGAIEEHMDTVPLLSPRGR